MHGVRHALSSSVARGRSSGRLSSRRWWLGCQQESRPWPSPAWRRGRWDVAARARVSQPFLLMAARCQAPGLAATRAGGPKHHIQPGGGGAPSLVLSRPGDERARGATPESRLLFTSLRRGWWTLRRIPAPPHLPGDRGVGCERITAALLSSRRAGRCCGTHPSPSLPGLTRSGCHARKARRPHASALIPASIDRYVRHGSDLASSWAAG